mgnify:CR=1 FL=1|jgi:hypothetical protein
MDDFILFVLVIVICYQTYTINKWKNLYRGLGDIMNRIRKQNHVIPKTEEEMEKDNERVD